MNDLDKNRDYCGRPSWLFAAWLRANRYAAQIRFERATPNNKSAGCRDGPFPKRVFFPANPTARLQKIRAKILLPSELSVSPTGGIKKVSNFNPMVSQL